jgi:hypothetical protein
LAKISFDNFLKVEIFYLDRCLQHCRHQKLKYSFSWLTVRSKQINTSIILTKKKERKRKFKKDKEKEGKSMKKHEKERNRKK